MPTCEVAWPDVCTVEAAARVRLFEADDTTREVDVCDVHEEQAAGEYPDNIKLVRRYDG